MRDSCLRQGGTRREGGREGRKEGGGGRLVEGIGDEVSPRERPGGGREGGVQLVPQGQADLKGREEGGGKGGEGGGGGGRGGEGGGGGGRKGW